MSARRAVAKAAPDGYTILLATTGQAATNKLMYEKMSFDPQKDFVPIVLIGKAPVIVVSQARRAGQDARRGDRLSPRPIRTS